MNENTKEAAKKGITFGTCLAMVISYANWHSVGWAIVHGLMSWLYVIKEFMSMIMDNDSTKITATSYIRCMPQTCAVNISVLLGLTGRLITTNTACTAGSLSIGYAAEAIASGEQNCVSGEIGRAHV